MSTLEVPGARLYYEVRGSGPLMVLIPGAPGHARVCTGLADRLARHYTVVTYDRRGFSRSHLVGAQDYARRLSTDALDVVRLIRCLDGAPATVFGTSSGGVVVMQLLVEHPEMVASVVPYEPPVMRLLPAEAQQRSLERNEELYELYRRQGPAPAQAEFIAHTFPESDRTLMNRPPDPGIAAEVQANTTYWFERELRQYTAAQFDHDVLIRHADKIIPAAGRASRGYPAHDTTVALAATLGRPVLELPGGHVGYGIEPAGFAHELRAALRGRQVGSAP